MIQLLSGWTEAAASSGGEEIGAYVEAVAATSIEVVAEDAPTCPNCFAALDETLAVKMLETTAEGESFSVKIAYCTRCGVALGAVT